MTKLVTITTNHMASSELDEKIGQEKDILQN